MRYLVNCAPPERANMEAALKIVDPQAVVTKDAADYQLELTVRAVCFIRLTLVKKEGMEHWEQQDQEINDPRYHRADRHQRHKELIRRGVIKLLGPELNRWPVWGILSGVRPMKIYHYLRAKGFTKEEIRQRLSSVYALQPAKAALVLETGAGQEQYLAQNESRKISLYLGIPFCPTRCHYCSFPAVPLTSHGHLVQEYLAALSLEITALGQVCRDLNLTMETVYLGGGTPTSLTAEDFGKLLAELREAFCLEGLREFTVEAGRPETISKEKLTLMSQHGVTRISVNPQTMQAKTLTTIGRNHTLADIYRAVELVGQFPSLALNMDLILGLPQETGSDFQASLTKVLALAPPNITLHTLAPKRAAAWRSDFSKLALHVADLKETSLSINEKLRAAAYQPYYLYRQRGILGDLENVGYAKPGFANIYNIQMMEEQQTIIGLGAGAITKCFNASDLKIERFPNPKCPATYSRRITEIISQKVQEIRSFLD